MPNNTRMRSNAAVTLLLAVHVAIHNVNAQQKWNDTLSENGGKAPVDQSTVHRDARNTQLQAT